MHAKVGEIVVSIACGLGMGLLAGMRFKREAKRPSVGAGLTVTRARSPLMAEPLEDQTKARKGWKDTLAAGRVLRLRGGER